METYDYRSCPIQPWVDEIVYRMHESHQKGTHVVNLSFTHPRGFIPSQILYRPAVRKVLAGWQVDNAAGPPTSYPTNHVWYAQGARDLQTDPLAPYEAEIALREEEARLEALHRPRPVEGRIVPVCDLTNFHPRGGIPFEIMDRLERRKDPEWVKSTRALIDQLIGDANKDIGFAGTQEERADGLKSKGEDPSKLLASAKELRARAKEAKAHAKFLESELG